jgi:hypothetical protein
MVRHVEPRFNLLTWCQATPISPSAGLLYSSFEVVLSFGGVVN